MVIRKGEPWGTPGALPPDGVVVRDDRAARTVLSDARREKRPFPVIGLLGGDLCRTLGGTGDEGRLRSKEAMTFSVDLGEALLDGRLHLFVAHLVAHRPLWLRPQVAVMNAAWFGDRNLGPKAHPNDGLLDVSEGRLSTRQLVLAAGRARHGTHVPHPDITLRRLPAVLLHFERPLPVWLDGERIGAFRDISARVEPDVLTVVV